MLSFFLASLIVGSGVVIGAVLSIIAKDELKPGRRYFLFMKNILFSAVILTVSVYYLEINPLISLFTAALISLLLIKRFQLNLIYAAFAAVYILSAADNSIYLLVSSLIFFAGFPMGTAAAHELVKKEIFVERKILTSYLIFVFIVLLKTAYSFL